MSDINTQPTQKENEIDLKQYIASIPGFPKEGIILRDVTPILANPQALEYVSTQLAEYAKKVGADAIVAPEARGFLFGIPAAMKANLPFIPVRKPGKLPREVVSQSYDLEYGQDTLQMHKNDLPAGSRVLVVDDLLATGGTGGAIDKMIRSLGSTPAGYAFVVELDDLNGRKMLNDAPVFALVHYEGE